MAALSLQGEGLTKITGHRSKQPFSCLKIAKLYYPLASTSTLGGLFIITPIPKCQRKRRIPRTWLEKHHIERLTFLTALNAVLQLLGFYSHK